MDIVITTNASREMKDAKYTLDADIEVFLNMQDMTSASIEMQSIGRWVPPPHCHYTPFAISECFSRLSSNIGGLTEIDTMAMPIIEGWLQHSTY